jgi:hypothetical protein
VKGKENRKNKGRGRRGGVIENETEKGGSKEDCIEYRGIRGRGLLGFICMEYPIDS